MARTIVVDLTKKNRLYIRVAYTWENIIRKIKKIILHTSDSPDSMDIGFKEINQWHYENSWMSPSGISCGYHYIVRRDGSIEKGRPDSEVGAHCYGQNKTSIGVVWVGRDRPTMRQNITLTRLLRYLINKYKLSTPDIYGHKEYDEGKTCPNLDMNQVRWAVLSNFDPIDPEDINVIKVK